MKKNERDFGLDLVKTVAVFCVLSIHGVAYTEVVQKSMYTIQWGGWVAFRYLMMSCVPLFLILTGYLQCKKEVSYKHYKGIVPMIVSYLIIASLAIVARNVAGAGFGILESIIKVLNYTANEYGWYAEMYIGLFLMIPFLNILYKALPSKKIKQLFLAICIANTLLPDALASFGSEQFFADIVPNYWKGFYPITYYYIGTYLREYMPEWKGTRRFANLMGVLMIPTTLCIITSGITGEYAWWVSKEYASLWNGLTAIGIFMICYDCRCNLQLVRWGMKEISICSFEIYLFSYIIDKIIYHTFDLPLFLMVLMSLALSYIGAKGLKSICNPILKKILSRNP